MENLNKQIRVTLKDGKQLKCKKCDGVYFMPVSSYFIFSKILTGAAKDSIQEIPVALCGQCGTPLDELLPAEMREDYVNAVPQEVKSKPKLDLSALNINA